MARPPKDDLLGFAYLRKYYFENGEMPSLRNIAAGIGYKSPRSVQMMLDRLDSHGLISYLNGRINFVHHQVESNGERTTEIPIVGPVSCGSLMLAEESVEGTVEISTRLAKPGHKYFILRARGDSMNLSGINDGDLVLIRQQPTAGNGEKVVGLVNDEATIKHFYRENGLVVLRPNSTDPSIRSIVLSEEFAVQGVVVSTLPSL